MSVSVPNPMFWMGLWGSWNEVSTAGSQPFTWVAWVRLSVRYTYRIYPFETSEFSDHVSGVCICVYVSLQSRRTWRRFWPSSGRTAATPSTSRRAWSCAVCVCSAGRCSRPDARARRRCPTSACSARTTARRLSSTPTTSSRSVPLDDDGVDWVEECRTVVCTMVHCAAFQDRLTCQVQIECVEESV